MNETSYEMPRYRHKEVLALTLKNAPYGPVMVPVEYVQQHKPSSGRYYVVCHGGYKSFSPAASCAVGYSRVGNVTK